MGDQVIRGGRRVSVFLFILAWVGNLVSEAAPPVPTGFRDFKWNLGRLSFLDRADRSCPNARDFRSGKSTMTRVADDSMRRSDMEAVSRMAVDLVKLVIQLHCVDRQEHVILRHSIPAERFAC
ncbi:hypothetical protein DIE12_11335 [Burkholderia sp. Bp9015]|nr:hypothetical protein DIE12_11335 [Burkholderia sp. Bp9015]